MFRLIKQLLTGRPQFADQRSEIGPQQDAGPPYVDVYQPPDTFGNLPPGFIPIESVFDMTNVPGTTLSIGNMARVFQTPAGELITVNLKRGVLLGCGHSIFTINEYATETGISRGLGGRCPFCATGAAARLNHGQITFPQAEAESRYCSACASECNDCHLNVCKHHALGFLEADGKLLSLCPICLPKAKRGLMRSRIVAAIIIILFGRRK